MSQYTTGEIAKLCAVTVRTVQYYDKRGVLVPSALSEGGRRLYSDGDLRRMKVICFLRGLGLSIDTIGKLLAEPDPGSVIEILLEQQAQALREEIGEGQAKLDRLESLRREVRGVENFSVESIGDIAFTMENNRKLKKLRWTMVLTGIPVALLQWVGILLWIFKGIWWVFAVWALVAVVFGVVTSRCYYKYVAYLCPQCHRVFKPTFKEMFFASHTPRTRKLTCPECGRKGYCVEVWAENQADDRA